MQVDHLFVFKGDISSLYSDIKNLRVKWTDDFPILAKDLVSKILRLRPSDRITLKEMLNHPWFKGNSNFKTDFGTSRI